MTPKDMAKRFFTQGLCVLFSSPPSVDALVASLPGVVKRLPGSHWEFGGPGVLLPFRPEVNGYFSVDIVDQQWPDSMGDQETLAVLTAWSMGHFGPFAFPLGLMRATQQAWLWPEADSVVAAHRAFVRIRLSYVFGAGNEVVFAPKDCDPLVELNAATKLARRVLDLPNALAFFNPNGEVLASPAIVRDRIAHNTQQGLPHLDLWSNVRLFKLDDDRTLMDTVGLGQLDLPDIEVPIDLEQTTPDSVAQTLRDVSYYITDHGDIIRHGDPVTDSQGRMWTAARVDEGRTPPPRAVIRLEAA